MTGSSYTNVQVPVDTKAPVLLVPGIINPVDLSYGPLLQELRGRVPLYMKELEVYATPQPPTDYSVSTEIAGIRRRAQEIGAKTFHLVGYSAGGLAALGYIQQYPEQLRSVTLIEQFGTGNQNSPDEVVFLEEAARVIQVPEERRVAAFLPLNLASGVPLPPVISPAPDWMKQRPAGIAALVKSAQAANFGRQPFGLFASPVLVVLGSLSNPVWREMARGLAQVFPDVTVQEYQGLHHLTPPQRAEPQRFASSLLQLWSRADEWWASHVE